MSILVACGPSFHPSSYSSPACAEIDRLRSRKHLLTLRPTFRNVGGDKEREFRRKQRQWKHWQSAMETAIREATQELAMKQKKTARPKLKLITEFSSVTFSSRSPILCNESQEVSRALPYTKAHQTYQFTFNQPEAPSWPGARSTTANDSQQRPLSTTRYKRRCLSSCIDDDSSADVTGGKRLLSRRRPAEQATIRRRTLWRSKSRSPSL